MPVNPFTGSLYMYVHYKFKHHWEIAFARITGAFK